MKKFNNSNMKEEDKSRVIDFLYKFYAPNGGGSKLLKATRKNIENRSLGTEYENSIYRLSTLITDASADYLISKSLGEVLTAFYNEIPEFFPAALQGVLKREYDS